MIEGYLLANSTTIWQFLDDYKKKIIIPPQQREYVWVINGKENQQIKNFFNTFENNYHEDSFVFFVTITYYLTKSNKSIEIIDGQQRILLLDYLLLDE